MLTQPDTLTYEPEQRETAVEGYTIPAVLVPLDGTADAKVALPIAAVLAKLEGCALHLAYVGKSPPVPSETAEAMELTREELRGLVIDRVLGDPAENIVRLSQDLSALVVMSTYTGCDQPREKLGCLAESVLCKAPHGIVLVSPERGYRAWEVQRILVPHDGTPAMTGAIDPAMEIAYRSGANVYALHVAFRNGMRPAQPGTITAPRYVDQPQHEWRSWSNEFVERLIRRWRPCRAVGLKLFVAAGQPGSEILTFAREHEADLIVVAWHGEWQPERAGTLKALIRNSGCPVFIVCAS